MVASGNGPTAIAVSPNGQFVYVANYNTDGTGGISQYTVGAGGALTPMATPTVAAGHNPEAITVSPNGQFAYVANNNGTGSGGVSQYTVGAGGELTPMATPTVAAGNAPYGIAVSPNGQYVYVTNGAVAVGCRSTRSGRAACSRRWRRRRSRAATGLPGSR